MSILCQIASWELWTSHLQWNGWGNSSKDGKSFKVIQYEIRWLSSVVHGHFYIYKLQSLDKSFCRWRQNGGSDKYFCPMTTWPIVTILGHWVTLQFNFLKTAMLIVTIAVWSIPIKREILILKLLPEFYRRGEIRSIFFILKNLLYSHTCKK